MAADADAIMTCWAQVPESVIAAAPRCRIVSRMGVGLDNIDVDYAVSKGIQVFNTAEASAVAVAELAFAGRPTVAPVDELRLPTTGCTPIAEIDGRPVEVTISIEDAAGPVETMVEPLLPDPLLRAIGVGPIQVIVEIAPESPPPEEDAESS